MIAEMERSPGDCCRLGGCEEYAAYLNHLSRIFALVGTWYQKLVEGGNTEAQIVEGFIKQLLYTVEQLRLKCLFSQSEGDRMILDLRDSGFPHHHAIAELESDLALQPERLPLMPGRRVVLEMMLDEMLRQHQDPTELLPQMAKVQFAEELDGNRLIFLFTPGELKVVTDGKVKGCLFSWLCYDQRSNMPYVHVLAFDYDGTTEELQAEFESGSFLPIIRQYGNRLSPIAVLASSIDDNLPKVFPKIVKRIRVGPISCQRYAAPTDDSDSPLPWLRRFGLPDDFALELQAETIFSQGEYSADSGWFSLGREKKVRQIFALTAFDPFAEDQRGEKVHRVLMLPHSVLQQATADPVFAHCYGTHQKVTYNEEGGIYAV